MKRIGAVIVFILDLLAFMLLGLLFGLVFIGAQIASWTRSEQ